MNKEAQERLDEILKKEPEALTSEDKAFLRARRSYLKKAQLEEYSLVLESDEISSINKISFQELLRQAKEMGFTGRNVKRGQLERWIAEHNNNPFIA